MTHLCEEGDVDTDTEDSRVTREAHMGATSTSPGTPRMPISHQQLERREGPSPGLRAKATGTEGLGPVTLGPRLHSSKTGRGVGCAPGKNASLCLSFPQGQIQTHGLTKPCHLGERGEDCETGHGSLCPLWSRASSFWGLGPRSQETSLHLT